MKRIKNKKLNKINTRITPAVGIVEWFRPGEHERVEKVLSDIKTLGVKDLRTGFSWADWHTEEGNKWYKWLMPRLGKEVEILPCFSYTPPSMGLVNKTSSPPQNAKSYADFLDVIITEFGRYFDWIELWNEPNNINEWDWRLDPNWIIFSDMIGMAAYWAQKRGKKTVLGGMSPIDHNWLELMYSRDVL
jgi:CDP-paratose 2-epimerase